MRDIRLFFTSLLFLAVHSLSQGQITQSKAGYLIFVKFNKGEVIKQNIGMMADGNSKLKSTTQYAIKCIGTDKNKVSTLEVTVSAGGKVAQTRKKMLIGKHGEPYGEKIEGYGGSFAWPNKPIKMGQSWVGNVSLAGTGQGNAGAIKSTYKLAGIKSIGGVKVACISSVMKVGGSFDVSGTGMIYVKFSDGQLHSADFNLGLKQYSDSGAEMRMKLLMTMRTVK